jgi:hypothetical protein
MRKLRRSVETVGERQLWAGRVIRHQALMATDAAPRTFLHKGRIADLRCKCEVGVRQQRELTFTLPKNSVFFCTAARRLGALFAKCCVLREHLLCTWSAIFIQYGTALLERINQHPHTFVQTLVGTIDDLHIECFEFEARQDRDKIAVVNRCGHQEVRQAG